MQPADILASSALSSRRRNPGSPAPRLGPGLAHGADQHRPWDRDLARLATEVLAAAGSERSAAQRLLEAVRHRLDQGGPLAVLRRSPGLFFQVNPTSSNFYAPGVGLLDEAEASDRSRLVADRLWTAPLLRLGEEESAWIPGKSSSDLSARLVTMAEASDPTDELARLAALLLRRLSGSQSELIVEMHNVGIGTTRIAELLGTTPNTANQAIQRARRAKRKGRT